VATVSFRIEDALKQRLDRLSEKHGLNVSHLFRQALAEKADELQHGPNRRAGITFSIKERLSLVNQFRMLAALYPGDSDRYLNHVEALESGYELQYPRIIEGFSDGLDDEECGEVLDVLDMYADLRYAFGRLGSDKSRFEESEIHFPGFDGNHETAQMAYAHYFTIDLDRFNSLHPGIEKHGLNSHWPMLPRYRKMIPVWRERRNPSQPLSAEDIRAVLAAGNA
jgi:uncharacterized protein YfbU (UPF0304 family)